MFAGQTPERGARSSWRRAGIGSYRGGVFVLHGERGPSVPARSLGGAAASRRQAVRRRWNRHRDHERLAPRRPRAIAGPRPRRPAPQELYLVPLATAEAHVGTLALLDPDGEAADDRLMESFASRAAAAYLHAARGR